jgi:hypothetical protein
MKNKTFQMLINLFVEKWRNFAREKKPLDRRLKNWAGEHEGEL